MVTNLEGKGAWNFLVVHDLWLDRRARLQPIGTQSDGGGVLQEAHRLSEETVEPTEVAEIVREACRARNGWKVILGRCAPEKRSTRRVDALPAINE